MRHSPFRLVTSALLAALLVGCSGGEEPTAPTDTTGGGAGGTPAPTTGTIALIVGGLPQEVRGDILVTGPGGFSRTATGTVTWTDVPVGSYTVTVRAVRTAAGLFAGPATAQPLQVTGGSVTATVSYGPVPAMVDVSVSGIPAAASVPLQVIRPDGRDTTLGATRAISGPAGRWRVSAGDLVEAATRFAPSPTLIDTTLRFGDTARVTLRFAPVTGSLAVAVSGLPAGTEGRVDIRGPDGYGATLTATRTLTMLTPGRYRVVSRAVRVAGIDYRTVADSVEVLVEPGVAAAPAPVVYAAQVGTLRLETTGLVAGTSVPVTLSGNGLTRSLTAPGRVDSLPVGRYTLTVSPTTVDGYRYAPLATTTTATVVAEQSVGVTLAYVVLPTILDVAIDGLPSNTAANVTLTAPNGERFTPVRSQRFLQAIPGRWTLAADTVTSLVARYAGTPAEAELTMAPGDTGRFAVAYAQVTGALAVAVMGIPQGASGEVTITGPNNYQRRISSTATLTHLVPGTYTVAAASVTVDGIPYVPSPASQAVTVVASAVAAPATVGYVAPLGDLVVAATGLPPGAVPAFTVAGTVTRAMQGPGRLSSIPAGSYTVTAGSVDYQGFRYAATPGTATATVTTGQTTTVSFNYAGGDNSTEPNLTIRYAYLVQAVQTAAGDVPLVAGRQAMVRVFVTANSDTNNFLPRVRVRLYNAGGTQVFERTIMPFVSGVKTYLEPGRYEASWNTTVDSSLVKPGLKLLVDLDPYNVPNESRTDDNVWPRDGQPVSVPVAATSPFTVRFVPVTVGSLTGNVTAANTELYLTSLRQLMPVAAVQSEVRPPFTSSITALTATGTTEWSTVLSELNALRASDGAAATQHYYGVVKVGYSAGIAGLGYVPGYAAMGWDDPGTAAIVSAHEWGHNFNRQHAPCGTSGDGQYPYSGGIVGQYGWVPGTGTIVLPTATDIMGYCGNQWVSDYTWNGVLAYRATSAPPVAPRAPVEGLLVWGRVSNGRVVLEPAFRVKAPITPVPAAGTHRLELLREDGAPLAALPLRAQAVDHGDGTEQQFAVVVPWTAELEQSLGAIRVSDVRVPVRTALRTMARGAAEGDPGATLESTGRQLRVRWQAPGVAMAMVRDATSGEILGFVRTPGSAVNTGGRRVEVVFSDGVRSAVRRPY